MTAARAPHLDVDIRLSVHDATRRFNLDVRFASQAPVVALYGPSGAGKSMTLQALAGLLRPAQGHIRLGERTLFDAAAGIHLPPQQRGLGYLFQHYALFPHLTVRQNIGFGLTTWWRRRPDRAAAARIDELIESLGLQSLPRPARTRCRVASSSGSPWRGRWPASPSCCCWTNPLPPSTPCCATSCARTWWLCSGSGRFPS